jgi:hypothetical protein
MMGQVSILRTRREGSLVRVQCQYDDEFVLDLYDGRMMRHTRLIFP